VLNPCCIVYAVAGRRSQQVLEQELAEAPAGLRRPQRLLELREVVGAREHLRRRPVELPELLDDLSGALAGALLACEEPPVDPFQPTVDGGGELPEPPVGFRAPLGELGGCVGPQDAELGPQRADEPDRAGGESGEKDDEPDEQHGRATLLPPSDGASVFAGKNSAPASPKTYRS
jgi:hypothetical protein